MNILRRYVVRFSGYLMREQIFQEVIVTSGNKRKLKSKSEVPILFSSL